MKLLILVFLAFTLPSRSQTCTLTGTIKSKTIASIQLYPLYADGPYSTAVYNLMLDKEGSFTQTLPLTRPVFMLLQTSNQKHRLLISPGRDLQVTLSEKDIQFKGAAAIENQLVHHSILDSVPTFTKNITLATWKDSMITPITYNIAASQARIEQAAIPGSLKHLLIRETRYAYQCYLSDFTRGDLRWSKNPDADTLQQLALQWLPMPDSLALLSGYYANIMVERHGHYAINAATRDKTGGREAMMNRLAAYLGMPFNNIDSLVKRYGERPVLPWLYARQHLPAAIRDKAYYNLILEAGDGVRLPACRFMLEQLQQQFPNSQYMPLAKTVVQQIETGVQKNASNEKIVIKDIGQTRSVMELLKQYAGKVVYLDVWGTWCGPCRQEVPFNAALKKRYQNKNIVFVYLALDDPQNDQVWRDYIQLNNIDGDHYRIKRKDGDSFWSDAKAAGIADLRSVPRYVIIDAQGTIVHGEAERPSSQQKLYDQLDKLL